jgi:hypothetical protein
MNTKYLKVSFIIIFLFQISFLFSQSTQDSSGGKFNITADLVSRFVWRGQNVGGSSPHLQPTLSYTNNGFEVGAWGSYGISNQYAEVDLYAKYSIYGFSAILTNYYVPTLSDGTPASANPKFYNFEGKTTANVLEFAFQYKGPESFPISIIAGTYLYGNDHSYGYDAELDADSTNYYSTYAELGYTFKVKEQNIDLFIGITPKEGFYGNGFGVVNLGLKGYRNIKITDNYSLPVYASLITNPQAETIYALFGITF